MRETTSLGVTPDQIEAAGHALGRRERRRVGDSRSLFREPTDDFVAALAAVSPSTSSRRRSSGRPPAGPRLPLLKVDAAPENAVCPGSDTCETGGLRTGK